MVFGEVLSELVSSERSILVALVLYTIDMLFYFVYGAVGLFLISPKQLSTSKIIFIQLNLQDNTE